MLIGTRCFICLIVLGTSLTESLGHLAHNYTHNLDRKPSPKPYTECDKPRLDRIFHYVFRPHWHAVNILLGATCLIWPLQWPPGYCNAEHCAKDAPEKFTIHGLWPNYCQTRQGHEWPQYCTREEWDKEGISDLLPRMEDNWISLSNSGDDSFWQHEWDKHGTCTVSYSQFHISSQHDYFKKALDLSASTNLQEILEDHNIRPGDSYSVDKIQEALKEGLGGQAFLNCERNNVLIEAELP